MDDFDKVQTPNAAGDSAKLKILGVLAVVLVGLVVHYVLKGGPQGASASTISAREQGPVSHQETPAEAQASLAHDPASSLLREPSASRDMPAVLPRNPFQLSPAWRSTLVRTVTRAPVASSPAAAPAAVSLDGYRLTGVFQQDQRLYAIVNGNILTVGMTVGSLRVADIHPTSVTFQRIDAPDGPRATLTIAPRLQ